MPKTKPHAGRNRSRAFPIAGETADMIGHWDWDAATDRVRVDAFAVRLFTVDPAEAEAGLPLVFYDGITHPDDRERVIGLIRRSAAEGSPYIAEYRVISIDGRTHWVLARGRIFGDHTGRPAGGRGILVDVTRLRASEGLSDEVTPGAGETPLDRAVEHAIAAQDAIVAAGDPVLKAQADALLMALGRRLAQRHMVEQRRRLN